MLKNWNHLLIEFIRVSNKSPAFLMTAKARSSGKHFIFMLSVIGREKSCFADEMVLIMKSRSHFLSLSPSLFTFPKRQRESLEDKNQAELEPDLGVLCTLSKIRSISSCG